MIFFKLIYLYILFFIDAEITFFVPSVDPSSIKMIFKFKLIFLEIE